jgi:hypothetical protein
LAKSTNHEAPRYAIFSILPSPHLSSVQISSSAPCSQTPSVSSPPVLKHPQSPQHLFSNTLSLLSTCSQTPSVSSAPVLKHPQPPQHLFSNTVRHQFCLNSSSRPCCTRTHIVKLLVLQSSLSSSPSASPSPSPSLISLLPTNVCFSLGVSDQVSYPSEREWGITYTLYICRHQTTGRLVIYVDIRRQEDSLYM